jgi:hypothetical protein
MAIAPAAKGGAIKSTVAAKAKKAVTTKKVVKSLPPKQTATQLEAEKRATQLSLNATPVADGIMRLNLPDREAVRRANEEMGYIAPTMTANTPTPFTLESDPVYQAALASGKSAFSFAQAQALADKQNQETGAAQQRRQLDTSAAEGRRRLAGNYAARGMAGGAAGALSMAEARANAEQIAAQTSITDQISALNNQYLSNFGNAAAQGYDWTGTLAGSQYKTQAAQAALQAQLAR